MVSLLPSSGQLTQINYCASRFGNVPKGSILSYQQKYSQEYVINDFICTKFPQLPLESCIENIENILAICLERAKLSALTSLQINRETAIEVEKGTTTQAANSMWHAMRSNRITASKFGIVAERLSKFDALTNQLSKGRHIQIAAMKRGITMEAHAAMMYAQNTKTCTVNLLPSGLSINPICPWLGCSPDQKVIDLKALSRGENPFGLLEIKVVKEGEHTFDNVAYLEKSVNGYELKRNPLYYYQVQCQLGLTGMDWCDFFSFIHDDTFVCQRIKCDAIFFQGAKDKVHKFYFAFFLH